MRNIVSRFVTSFEWQSTCSILLVTENFNQKNRCHLSIKATSFGLQNFKNVWTHSNAENMCEMEIDLEITIRCDVFVSRSFISWIITYCVYVIEMAIVVMRIMTPDAVRIIGDVRNFRHQSRLVIVGLPNGRHISCPQVVCIHWKMDEENKKANFDLSLVIYQQNCGILFSFCRINLCTKKNIELELVRLIEIRIARSVRVRSGKNTENDEWKYGDPIQRRN